MPFNSSILHLVFGFWFLIFPAIDRAKPSPQTSCEARRYHACLKYLGPGIGVGDDRHGLRGKVGADKDILL